MNSDYATLLIASVVGVFSPRFGWWTLLIACALNLSAKGHGY